VITEGARLHDGVLPIGLVHTRR